MRKGGLLPALLLEDKVRVAELVHMFAEHAAQVVGCSKILAHNETKQGQIAHIFSAVGAVTESLHAWTLITPKPTDLAPSYDALRLATRDLAVLRATVCGIASVGRLSSPSDRF